jgi:hypothetical protein
MDGRGIKRGLAGAGLAVVALFVSVAYADTIDRPTPQQGRPLVAGTEVTGTFTLETGFPSHRYTASRDGFVRIELDTTNLASRPQDNGGKAWRPYLRVISVSSPIRHGEAWSTNGNQLEVTEGRSELVLRVKAGEQFDVIATLAQNFVKAGPAARANYRLVATEVSP